MPGGAVVLAVERMALVIAGAARHTTRGCSAPIGAVAADTAHSVGTEGFSARRGTGALIV